MRNLLRVEDTHFPVNKHLRTGDKLFDLSEPKVMGIINLTPDSFYSRSRFSPDSLLLKKVETMVSDGADLLDLGGYSSRPGASEISVEEELSRVIPALKMISQTFPEIPVSLDTFRSEVARQGLENGASIINDISAWEIDPELLNVVAHYRCPYILMHMKGTPSTMQQMTSYEHLFNEITQFLSEKISALQAAGVHDIIVDPGFGFGKTIEQNYELLEKLDQFHVLGKPILAGLSRKSMIWKKLGTSPETSLNGTTALNTVALLMGADILRVHDVKEAKEIIRLLR